jgi:hypothetical protein
VTPANSADIEAARLLFSRLGVSAADLLATAAPQATAPTFAEVAARSKAGKADDGLSSPPPRATSMVARAAVVTSWTAG